MSGLSLQIAAARSARNFEMKKMDGTVTGPRYYAAWKSFNKGTMGTTGADEFISPQFAIPNITLLQSAIASMQQRQAAALAGEMLETAQATLRGFNIGQDIQSASTPSTEQRVSEGAETDIPLSETLLRMGAGTGQQTTVGQNTATSSSASTTPKFDVNDSKKLDGLLRQVQAHEHTRERMAKAVNRGIQEMRKSLGTGPTAILDQCIEAHPEKHVALRETLASFDKNYLGNREVVKREIQNDLEALVYANSPATTAILLSNMESLRIEATAHGVATYGYTPGYLTDEYMISKFADRVSENESTRKIREYLEDPTAHSRTWQQTMEGVNAVIARKHVTLDQRFALPKVEHRPTSPKHMSTALAAQSAYGQQRYGGDPAKPQGVCYAFQRTGECSRGDTCKFAHPSSTLGKRPHSPSPTPPPSPGSTASSPAKPVCSKFLQGKCPYKAADCPIGTHNFRSASPYRSPARQRDGGNAAGSTPARR
jgi:Zinc finger C-x8-C-x5-C-x3-H type (and similar)